MPPTLERFALDELPPRPWKNGGGTTREIAAMPPGAGTSDFAWRVSVAEIERAGPFSAFPGVDRQIVLLSGAGVRLRGAGVDHRLERPLEPFAFGGEVAVEADLLGGPSRDLNVMVRRGVVRAEVRAVGGPTAIEACDALVLFAARGAWRASYAASAAGGVVSAAGGGVAAAGGVVSAAGGGVAAAGGVVSAAGGGVVLGGGDALAANEGLVLLGGAPALDVGPAAPGGALLVIRLRNERSA